MYICIYIYICVCVCVCVRVLKNARTFFKRTINANCKYILLAAIYYYC